MSKKIALVAISAVVLAACSPTVYNKPGGTEEDLQRQVRICKYEAARSNQLNSMFSDPVLIAVERNNMVKLCLEANGWSPATK